MLSADSQLCLAVLLAAFCHIQADGSHKTLVSSRHRDNHGFGNGTQCSWNCTVIESDLSEEMKTTIAKNRLIKLVVQFEKKVDDKCVSRTSRNSSGNATEHWQIWLANKQPTFAKAMESLANLISCTDSNDEHKIRATCTLKPTRTTATNPVHINNGIQFPLFFRGHLADRGVAFDTIDCSTEETDNLQPCVNISKSTGNHNTDSKNPLERGGWPVTVLYSLSFVFLLVFIHYSPAFLCLFSPTEVTEDGVRQIILEGASPVSFRSPVANYFFSGDDGTIWHKARTFILRVVVMPLPFLGPAILTDFKIYGSKMNSFQRFMIVCFGCYCISAFYISFFTARSFQKKPCFVCKFVKPQILTCQEELPRLIINHLRLQPLILVECWRWFIWCLKSYFKMLLIVLPSYKVSIVRLLRFSIFIVFLFAIPAVAVILLIAIPLVAFIGIALTSPIVILCKARTRTINVPFLIVLAIRYYVTVLATLGAILVLFFAGIATLYALLLGFALLFSEESLPYVACFVLVLYYVWSSYSSFTNKYHDLGLTLFKRYKTSRHDKFTEMALNIDPVHENTSNAAANNEDNVIKIPKELFYVACEELMPIREGVCILILKIIIIVSFVFIVFLLTMLFNVGATPVMKALVTFLTGIFPKIVAIYIEGGSQKKLETMITDEKIPKIVQEYLNMTSGSNQAKENCDANIDELVILVNANEENIELVNM